MYCRRLQLSLLLLCCALSVDFSPCYAQIDINQNPLLTDDKLEIIQKFMDILQVFLEKNLIAVSAEEIASQLQPSETLTTVSPTTCTMKAATVATITPATTTLSTAAPAATTPTSAAPCLTPVPSTTLANDIPPSRKRFCFIRNCVKFKNDKGYIF